MNALDYCCTCGGGNYLCDNIENNEILFYGRCNCSLNFIWSNLN